MIPALDKLEPLPRKRLMQSILVALAILAGGMFWTLQVAKDSHRLNHILGHERQGLEDLRRIAGEDARQ